MQGVKSEVSAIRKGLIRQLSSGRLDKIIEAMEDKEYVSYCLAVMEYCLPKLQRTELTGEDGKGIEVRLPGKPDVA